MDKLYNTRQELVQQISVEHTKKILGGKIEIMFYDVTTPFTSRHRKPQRQTFVRQDSPRTVRVRRHKLYWVCLSVKMATPCHIPYSTEASMKDSP